MDAVRRKEILSFLQEQGKASVHELARALYVSEATVRRDLNEMQRLGLIERSHGGAVLADTDEMSIFVRKEKNAREKAATAEIASRHLPDFQTVFLDNSSTCLELVGRLSLAGKTAVTNGLQVALSASKQRDGTTVLTGGEIKYNLTATSGAMTVNVLRGLRFDLALLSCAAVDGDGSYEHSLEAMQLKQLVMENSRKTVLLFDSTKANTSSHFRTAPFDSYDLIVTDSPDSSLLSLRSLTSTPILNR